MDGILFSNYQVAVKCEVTPCMEHCCQETLLGVVMPVLTPNQLHLGLGSKKDNRRSAYPNRKHLVTGGVPYPEPQMDWELLRHRKARCEAECAEFDHTEGACGFHLLPTLCCGKFRSGGMR